MIKSVHEVAVLSALKQSSTHGYILLDSLGIKSGSLYPILSRLAHKGFITGVIEPGEDRPDRTVYAITLEGMEELKIVKRFMGVK